MRIFRPPRAVRPRGGRERRAALPAGHARGDRRSPSLRRSRSSPRCARRGVAPLSVGRTIVATWTPHETTVLEAIRDAGARAAGHLQQGRRHGAAVGRQQGDRPARGAPGARPVRAQRGRRRRRRERPRVPVGVRVRRRGRERAAAAQGARRPRDRGAITARASSSSSRAWSRTTSRTSALPRHRLALGAREDGTPVSLDPLRLQRAARRHLGQRQVDVRDEPAGAAAASAATSSASSIPRATTRRCPAPSCWAAPTACRRRRRCSTCWRARTRAPSSTCWACRSSSARRSSSAC